MKITRGVLAVVFGWSASKTLEILSRPGALDRLLFEGSGLGWLFPLILIPLAVLQLAAVYFVFRPATTIAYRSAIAAVVLGLIETAVASALSMANPALLKQAIIASRTERGLDVRPEVLRLADNPVAQLAPLLLSAVFACVWLFLIVRLRRRHVRDAS